MNDSDMNDKLLQEMSARGIATLTMNRPDVANTYDQDMLDGLYDAFGRLAQDESVRAIVLRGAGRHFCGGGDQRRHGNAPARAPDAPPPPTMADVCARLRAVPQPTIAAIQGACMGGALTMACCCDIRIVARNAFFGLPEVRLGFATGPDTALPVVRAMGLRSYRRYAMTGQRFGAQEALRNGLAHELCENDALDKALEAQTEEIMLAAPNAARGAKRIADALELRIPPDAFAGLPPGGRNTPEAREGLAAFKEKRKPSWYR